MKKINFIKYALLSAALLLGLSCNARYQDNKQLEDEANIQQFDKNNIEQAVGDIDKDAFNIKVYELIDKDKNRVKYMIEYDKMIKHISLNQWAAESAVKEHFCHMLQTDFTRKDLEQMLK